MLCAAIFFLAAACSDPKGDFIGPRVLDNCGETWPVCNTQAGCVLGPESYIEGTLPHTIKFEVTLGEPSTVRVHLYLADATAAGTLTTLTWNEPGCVAHVDVQVTGEDLLKESQTQGEFFRDELLQVVGDHLITVDSDARASYDLKIDILTARGQ
jgi:hypothetical protein